MPSAVRVAVALVLQAIAQPAVQPGRLTEGIPCPSDPTETYTIYLPASYTTSRTWPLLFVFDPGGRGARAAEVFREAAERYGWIVVGSENSRNGPWEPTRRSIAAMWPAVLQRYAVDERRIYSAGHSGGATVAWMVATESGQFAGVVGSGEPDPGPESKPAGFAWFGTAGRSDFNYIEVRRLDARVAKAGAPHRMEFFDGGHQWLPPPLPMHALGWFEVVAMKQGRRPRDSQLAGRILADDLARARELESAGFLTEAHRDYVAIVDTFSALADVSEARTRARSLEADDRFKRATRDEQRSDERERARLDQLGEALNRLYRADTVTLPDVRGLLDISGLAKTARGTSYEASAARRSLETIYMQVANEAPRELERRREFGRAAVALELAAEIHPERPRVWFDLGAARAASGNKAPAIEALQRAIGAGFTDKAALSNDERFALLRSYPPFVKLVEDMK